MGKISRDAQASCKKTTAGDVSGNPGLHPMLLKSSLCKRVANSMHSISPESSSLGDDLHTLEMLAVIARCHNDDPIADTGRGHDPDSI